jgi:hypothetical protein
MNFWKKSMRLFTDGKLIEKEDTEIQPEIFQCDSLSALLFCMSLIPQTEQMNKLDTGYEAHNKDKSIMLTLHG